MSRCAVHLSLVVVLLLSSFARAQLAPDGVVADAMKAAGDGKLDAQSSIETQEQISPLVESGDAKPELRPLRGQMTTNRLRPSRQTMISFVRLS
jgi:hypothetical protein